MQNKRWAQGLLALLLTFSAACQEPETDKLSSPRKRASSSDDQVAPSKSGDSKPKSEDKKLEDETKSDPEIPQTPEIKLPEIMPKPMDGSMTHMPQPMNLSAGCKSETQLPEGTQEFMQGALKRKYIVHRPKDYSKDKAWPLVLALHPNGSNTSFWDATSGDRAIRKLFGDKAIILIAEARKGDWRGDLPTELAYFETIIGQAKAKLCLDEKKIFSMGFSGGGSFSGVLGCMRSDIRAFAAGGAIAYFEKDKCIGKPAAWITIGDKEAVQERKDFVEFWREKNQCSKEAVKGKPETCQEFACSNAMNPTIFCSHPGDHVWPSFGAEAAWSFFSRFLQ